MSDVSVSVASSAEGQDIVAQMRTLLLGKPSIALGRQPNFREKQQPEIKAAPQLAPSAAEPEPVNSDTFDDVSVAPAETKSGRFSNLRTYVILSAVLTIAGISAVIKGNQLYGSEMYGHDGMVPAAEAASRGMNYAVFDLNLNIRHLRDETVKRMTKTPDVVLLGASHWQEAHAGLVTGLTLYNSHIHRDYWEDPLGVVEIFERNNRLPKRMIIAIRDKQFLPVNDRTDYLWEPGIPYYKLMAERIGLKTEAWWKTLPYQRARALLSISMLFENATRWYNAQELPHATMDKHFKSLDTLLPDGSILWSANHKAIFTAERRKAMAKEFADASRQHPPVADPLGLEAMDALLKHLKDKGVEVYLVHPPFNPEFYDAMQGSRYMEGLHEIENITQDFAKKYGFKVFGSFNPHDLGCVADDYIDAEHANPRCLKQVFDQFNALVRAEGASS